MRVLFAFNYPHLPELVGGLQTTTHDLCLAIKAMGAEAAVLCGRTHETAAAGVPTADESLGYLTLRADHPEQALPMAAAAWGADVIVVQSGTALAPMLLASLATGRPTAVYLHNVETHQLAGNLLPDPSLLYLANSAFTAQRWHALYGIDCAVIPPVVAPDAYLADHTGDHVLFVNPTPVKGIERLFDMAQACPDLPFLVMESWQLDPYWRAHCRDRAARLGNIEWHAPAEDMRQVFARTRMLLMPSVWEESFGRTVIEAQLNGLPVLASNRGALPQLVGEGGLVLAPEAPVDDWALALRRLYDPEISTAQRDAARRQGAAHVAATTLVVGQLLSLLALHASQSTHVPDSRRHADSSPPRPRAASSRPATALAPAPATAVPVRDIAPRQPRLEECLFYHAVTLANGDEMTGEWDLRPDPGRYLGDVDFAGRSVLEIGPASGFLSFHMEAAGADVTCLEPPMAHLWDVVPLRDFDTVGWKRSFTKQIEQVRNAFWYLYQERNARARMVEADPYRLPDDFGPFDIGVLTSVLLHCRRPFDLLESVAARTTRSIIITEVHEPTLGERPVSMLVPHDTIKQVDTWWLFTPQFFISTLSLFGFTESRVTYHKQKQPAEQREVDLFTVVCERPLPAHRGGPQ